MNHPGENKLLVFQAIAFTSNQLYKKYLWKEDQNFKFGFS